MPVLRSILKMYVANAAQHNIVCAAATQAGYNLGTVYSPLACEVCGVWSELIGQRAYDAGLKVNLGAGEYVGIAKSEIGGALLIAAGCSLQAGEATLWGVGLGGQCNCDKPSQAHWS